jgi:LemA protein
MPRKINTGAVLGLGLLAIVVGGLVLGIGAYNRLINLSEGVESQWAQVENVYQRRADLIPNLVETVKATAKHERETLTAVIEARSRAVQISGEHAKSPPDDPRLFEQYQKAQDDLSNALSRLMVVVEQYPNLQAPGAFRDLMTQLEGTENRIAVERMRFNETARDYNIELNRFPTVVVARFFGDRFKPKPYFEAQKGTESPPQVRFD